MSQKSMIGIVLIAIGIIAFTYQGITYKTREKAMDLGSLQITTETRKNIPLPPVVGAVALIGGITLMFMGTKK